MINGIDLLLVLIIINLIRINRKEKNKVNTWRKSALYINSQLNNLKKKGT